MDTSHRSLTGPMDLRTAYRYGHRHSMMDYYNYKSKNFENHV